MCCLFICHHKVIGEDVIIHNKVTFPNIHIPTCGTLKTKGNTKRKGII